MNYKIKLIGKPSEETLYVSPDKIDLIVKTILLPEYRNMIIPQITKDQRIKILKENLEDVISKYESGKLKKIEIIPSKNIITTNRTHAIQESQKFSMHLYENDKLMGTYDINQILEKYDKESLRKEIQSEYSLME